MLVKIQVDDRTANRLVEMAAAELRPVHLQAEVLLMNALGTWREPSPAGHAIVDASFQPDPIPSPLALKSEH